MNISEAGIELIKSFESCRLDAYRDSVGVLTIGYGHIFGVYDGQHITEEEAERLLKVDLEMVEKCLANCVKVDITQSQYDALCSFTFNLGCGALRNSRLLLKLNDMDDEGAAFEFTRWDHAGGKVLAGLTRRRKAESELFSA